MDITMGTAQSVSKPIGLREKVVERREVKVAVWMTFQVEQPSRMLPRSEYQNIVDTDFNPARRARRSLNDVFDPPGFNAVFDCKVNHIDVRSTRRRSAFGAPCGSVEASNWTLDKDLALGQIDPIRLAGYDDTKSINLYIVSANFIGINTWLPHRIIFFTDPSTGERPAELSELLSLPEDSKRHLQVIVAREIGHILIGPGHPDENTSQLAAGNP